MKTMRFQKPRLYLRKDPDAGWTLAVWKWRIFFGMSASPKTGGAKS